MQPWQTQTVLTKTQVKYARFIATILAITILWIFLAWGAANALIVQKELSHADLIVVLAGSSTHEERALRAAELFKQGRASKILLTNDQQRGGWSETKQTNPYFVDLASEELQKLGIRSDQIEIVSAASGGTYHEATIVRDYAQHHTVKSLLIVTSAYHSRRALWTYTRVFEGSGIDVGLDHAPTGLETPSPSNWWLHIRGWQIVPVEYVKMLYYRVRF